MKKKNYTENHTVLRVFSARFVLILKDQSYYLRDENKDNKSSFFMQDL